jgi:hypothetical protein
MFYLSSDETHKQKFNCQNEKPDRLLMPSTSEESVDDYIQTFKPSFIGKNIQGHSKAINSHTCKKVNASDFDQLREFGIALRRALSRPKTILSCVGDDFAQNAYNNLTYVSSVDEINEPGYVQNFALPVSTNKDNQNEDALKKTLKSIKRKDKLRQTQRKSLSCRNNKTSSIQELEENTKEFEKKLKKKYRCKSYARSIRRAKTVYYLNQRSKSLEDLTKSTGGHKSRHVSEWDISNGIDRKHGGDSVSTSCSSFTTGCASDLSSSYFHELSDLSPEIDDSDSIYSDSVLLKNFDWDAYLPDIQNVRKSELLERPNFISFI